MAEFRVKIEDHGLVTTESWRTGKRSEALRGRVFVHSTTDHALDFFERWVEVAPQLKAAQKRLHRQLGNAAVEMLRLALGKKPLRGTRRSRT